MVCAHKLAHDWLLSDVTEFVYSGFFILGCVLLTTEKFLGSILDFVL